MHPTRRASGVVTTVLLSIVPCRAARSQDGATALARHASDTSRVPVMAASVGVPESQSASREPFAGTARGLVQATPVGAPAAAPVTRAAATRPRAPRRPSLVATAADTTPTVALGGFVDAYYAWDVNQPRHFDRVYTTQPARHANFNINLAFVEAKLQSQRYRGRLALQFGTSVQANYVSEPHIGEISGPSLSQFLQEATAGYQLTPTLWVDGGIFFAHTGYEGWISRDNLAYTRSLIADFSPYYEAGVKFTWTPSSRVTAQLDIVNGWQNISNDNTPPAVGGRVDVVLTPTLTVSYDNFVGNVAADSLPVQLRVFHDFIAQYNPPGRWQFAGAYDIGTQTRSTGAGGTATWTGYAVFAKYHATPVVALVVRGEAYADPDQVIVQTKLPSPLEAMAASLGVDVTPASRVAWRTEIRAFRSDNAIWPTHRLGGYSRNDAFAVTSLAWTF